MLGEATVRRAGRTGVSTPSLLALRHLCLLMEKKRYTGQ